jgi:D-serine deaminase-like pyridoxal phosphate-dependent protein
MPQLASLSTIPTPFVVIDRGRLERNIANMQARAKTAGVRLRPHAKTHKSPAIAQRQIEAGAKGICCAKLGEAEVFVAAGIGDIRLPYPIHPSNAERVLALTDHAKISIVVDDESVASGWSDAMVAAGRRLAVLVKVDVGFHRCGVDPDRADIPGVIHRIAKLPGLEFRGLLSHAGHSYLAKSGAEIEAIAKQEAEILNRLAEALRAADTPVPEISVGSTPTARFIASQPGVTEMRPGNYVFVDRTQVGLGAARLDDCAQSVVSTVVSRPTADRVILDAGSKTLTSDGVRGFGNESGYGLVYPSLSTARPDPTLQIERLSEEHATVRVPATCTLRIGDRVRIIPNHSCVVTNLADELILADGETIVERLPVAARGKNT